MRRAFLIAVFALAAGHCFNCPGYAQDKAPDEAKRKYDLMSDTDRRAIDAYRKLVADHGKDAAENMKVRKRTWFLVSNAEQFTGHDIVASVSASADKMGVEKLAKSQDAKGETLTRLKVEFFELFTSDINRISRLIDKVNASGIGSLSDTERSFIRNRPLLFPKWSK